MGLKENRMNISYYDFHDGYLIDIKNYKNKIEIFMESAEIDPIDMKDNLELSEHQTLKGKLHIENIKIIKIDNKVFQGEFKKKYDEGDIYRFKIKNNIVTLLISWTNYPPKDFVETDMFTYEIEAERIYWENVPNLHNPFWL